MKSNNQGFTIQSVIWLAGILTGVFLRIFYLGVFSLDNPEATLAIQAYNISRGVGAVTFGGNPLYLVLTTGLFQLLGSSNLIARLIPSLAGIALLFFPYAIRSRINPGWMVTLTWFLAIEPSLVSVSRISSGDMLAMTVLLFTLASWLSGKYKTTALFLGLALLCGPTIWFGLVVCGLSVLLVRLISGEFVLRIEDDSFVRKPFFWGLVAASSGIVSSFLLLIPNGLSSFGNSLVEFTQFVTKPGNTSIRLTLLAIPLYTPLVFFSGLIALVQSFLKRSQIGIFCSFTALIAFIFILLLPGRQLALLIWVTVPLIYLSTDLISHSLSRLKDLDQYTWIITGFVLLILCFIWQVFGTLNQGNLEMSNFLLYFGASVVILLVCAILAILGWSVQTTGMGYAVGFMIVSFALTMMSAFRTVGNLDNPRMEFWNDGVEPAQVELLKQTVEEVSGRVRGVPNGLDIISLGKIQPSIAWAMREQNIIRVEGLASIEDPALVLTQEDIQLQMDKTYRGQDFDVQSGVDWNNFSIQDWLRWYMIRKAQPTLFLKDILWVRADLFPGYRSTIIPAE